MLFPLNARAEPILVGMGGHETGGKWNAVLYDEKANCFGSQRRATFVNRDGMFEGCYALHKVYDVFILYFDDEDIAYLPIGAFKRANPV